MINLMDILEVDTKKQVRTAVGAGCSYRRLIRNRDESQKALPTIAILHTSKFIGGGDCSWPHLTESSAGFYNCLEFHRMLGMEKLMDKTETKGNLFYLVQMQAVMVALRHGLGHKLPVDPLV